jgi:iron complex outermembrane recepter protein
MAPAAAVAQAAPAATPAEGEVIVVTGSRIATRAERAISPVRVLDAATIQAANDVNIDEFLKTQNQFLPSNGATTNPTLLESHGASTLDMRGLGQNRTLVLVNGQRAVPNGFRNSTDVNAIPNALIDRIETLTGGAAAVYGADAVAGVTNYILKDSYEGLQLTGTYGQAEEGDATSYAIGATWGMNFAGDRGNIVLHAGYTERGELQRRDRDWAVPEVNDAGAFIQTFPTAGGSFTRLNGTTPAATPLFAYSATGALQATAGTNTFSDLEAFWNPNDRTNAAVFANFEVAPFLELYGRFTYSLINNTSQQIPVRSNGNPAAQDVLIQRNNPFITPTLRALFEPGGSTTGWNLNAAGTAAGTEAMRVRVAKTLTEMGPLLDLTERTQQQLVVGMRGDLGANISYDLAYVTGETVEDVIRNGWGALDRYLQATNATTVNGQAVCVNTANGCVPYNLFGPNAASPEAVAWVYGDPAELFNQRNRTQDVLSLTFTGSTEGFFSLPAGPIGWAVGAERREEWGNSIFGTRAATRNHLHTQGARADLVADFELTEYYAEVRLPILSDLPFIQQFDIEAAGRHSQHSRSGDYDTWKLGASWQVTDSLRFRGSQQSVVRGPNIGEFFGAAVEAPITGTGRPTDYCSDPARFNVPTALCTALGAPATPGYLPLQGTANLPLIDGAVAVQGGGEAIRPESGDTYTYGFVYQPQWLRGLSLIVDYYHIQIDDAIGTITPVQLMESCYLVLQDASSALCQKIQRNPAGQVIRFDQRDTNLTLLKTAGWDFSVGYNARMPVGLPGDRINILFTGGTVDTFVRLLFPSDNLFDCAGKFGGGACSDAGTGIRAIPQYRHNLNVAWTNDDLTLRFGWRLTGQVDALIPATPVPTWRNVAVNTNAVQHIDTQDYLDLGFSYRVTENLRIGGSVTNLFDVEPPLLGSAQSDANTLPGQYDIIGRRFGLNFTWTR